MVRDREEHTRVLIVEDDAWIRTFLRDVLSDAGYAVLEAADGRTGLRLAQQERPRLVLLDLAMPEFTGIDVLSHLRQSACGRDIPVLIMSAYTKVLSVRDMGKIAGVLPKPLDVSECLRAVKQILSH
jgi:DNA-binding response OmpR family regulator